MIPCLDNIPYFVFHQEKGIAAKHVKKLQFDQRLVAISQVAYSHPIKVSKWTEADQGIAAQLIVWPDINCL